VLKVGRTGFGSLAELGQKTLKVSTGIHSFPDGRVVLVCTTCI